MRLKDAGDEFEAVSFPYAPLNRVLSIMVALPFDAFVVVSQLMQILEMPDKPSDAQLPPLSVFTT